MNELRQFNEFSGNVSVTSLLSTRVADNESHRWGDNVIMAYHWRTCLFRFRGAIWCMMLLG